MKLNKLF